MTRVFVWGVVIIAVANLGWFAANGSLLNLAVGSFGLVYIATHGLVQWRRRCTTRGRSQ